MPGAASGDAFFSGPSSALAVRLAWIALEPGNRIVADEGMWLAWGIEVLPSPDVRFSPFAGADDLPPAGLPLLHRRRLPRSSGGSARVEGGPGRRRGAARARRGLLGRRAFGERAGLVGGRRRRALSRARLVHVPLLGGDGLHDARSGGLSSVMRPCCAHRWRLPASAPSASRCSRACSSASPSSPARPCSTSSRFWLSASSLRAAGAGSLAAAVLSGRDALAVVAPWTWRNHVVFDAFVPVSTSGGLNLFQGNARLTRQQVYDEYHAVRGRIAKYEFARRKGIEAILERQPWWIFEKLRDEMPNFWEADSQALVHVRRGAYGEPRLAPRRVATAVVVLPYLALLVLVRAGGRAAAPQRRCVLLVAAFSPSTPCSTWPRTVMRATASRRCRSLFLVAAVGRGSVRRRSVAQSRRRGAGSPRPRRLSYPRALGRCRAARFLLRADTLVSGERPLRPRPAGPAPGDGGGER